MNIRIQAPNNLRLLLLPLVALLGACELIEEWPHVPGHPGPAPGPGPSAGLGVANGSLAGFTVYEAKDKQNHPDAGDPRYIYLLNGKDAVRLPGPPVPDTTPSLLSSASATFTTTKEGMTVRLNDRLSYVVSIEDFEGEVSLARVELQTSGTPALLTSSFIFAARGEGLGGGVAHNLTIRAVVDGVTGPPTAPQSIEAR